MGEAEVSEVKLKSGCPLCEEEWRGGGGESDYR